MKKTLPEFYYLTHFHEFLQTIGEHFAHLLRESDQAFIREFQVAQQAEQAIIVRIINRSQPWVRRETLNYPEIPTWQQALAALENKHWIGTATTLINTNNLKSFLRVLTKSDLQRVYSDADAAIALQIRKSASKQHWLDACSQLHHVTVRNLSIAKTFVALHSDLETTIRYLLFIYFGRMETDFKQFSLRDLGIRTTHEQAIVTNESSPRYASIAEAESAFYYSELRRLLADGISEPFEVDAIEDWPAPIGHHAERLAASCRFYYGDALKVTNPQRACAIWRETLHPKAQEQAVRLLFQCGNHAAAIELAKAIIDDPLDDSLALFAEDFVARKVGGKRTSILTDLLRNSLPEVAIDEAYRGAVERGVMAWHERHGRRCFHSENNMWRALFVIFFWPELIDSKEGGFVSEFDRTPRLLQANSFY
ncbi:MAG TPA: hypothetical protein VFM61_04515, partial [Pseudidiomarina sp.]|nr:hypothetical protein [Pseudidiomarina sp.]